MSVHSCCCIIFCIAWFEVGFQIELKFHFEIALEKLEKEKNEFLSSFPASGLLTQITSAACFCPWPISSAPARSFPH